MSSFLDGTIDPASMRRIGLPWSAALVRRTLIGTGSAVLAARLALQYGVAVMCNGGTHHAHAARGAGWCIFNDQVSPPGRHARPALACTTWSLHVHPPCAARQDSGPPPPHKGRHAACLQ